jgi:heme-degrading monooxygenase HmoA
MFAVIFEVQPKIERFDDYLALAKQLKPKLEAIDGFIDNERFKSKRDEGRLVSLARREGTHSLAYPWRASRRAGKRPL